LDRDGELQLRVRVNARVSAFFIRVGAELKWNFAIGEWSHSRCGVELEEEEGGGF
jgi:hypothetical protein